jgi:PD-(D/E)XK nuclease superfamily
MSPLITTTTATQCRWNVVDCAAEFRHYHAPAPDGEFDTLALPSVTEVLKVLAKPALLPWAFRMGRSAAVAAARQAYGAAAEVDVAAFALAVERVAPRSLDELPSDALSIGSRLHARIEAEMRCELGEDVTLPPIPERPHPTRVAYEAFLRWRHAHEVRPLAVEQRVYSQRGYAGTVDFFGYVDDRLTVADWKTSGGVYPEHRLQLAAYRAAVLEGELMGEPELAGLVVRFPKDGAPPRCHEVAWAEQAALMEDFGALLHLWRRGLGR